MKAEDANFNLDPVDKNYWFSTNFFSPDGFKEGATLMDIYEDLGHFWHPLWEVCRKDPDYARSIRADYIFARFERELSDRVLERYWETASLDSSIALDTSTTPRKRSDHQSMVYREIRGEEHIFPDDSTAEERADYRASFEISELMNVALDRTAPWHQYSFSHRITP